MINEGFQVENEFEKASWLALSKLVATDKNAQDMINDSIGTNIHVLLNSLELLNGAK